MSLQSNANQADERAFIPTTTGDNYALCIALLFPPSTEDFVEVDEGEVLVADGIADADLSIEVAALSIEDVDVVEGTAAILEEGKLDIFCGSIAQLNFKVG